MAPRLQAHQQSESDARGWGHPDQELDRGELESTVRRAVERLPPRTREVVTLRWQRSLTFPEIALVMGISVKTVEAQMQRALRMLRSLLGERE